MANSIKIGNIDASAVKIGTSTVSAVYIGSEKVYPNGETPIDYSRQYLTFEVVEGGDITIKASKSNVAKTIQYSLDNGSTWTSLTTSTSEKTLGGTLSVGSKVLVKGTNTAYATRSYNNNFGGTAKVNVYGNIMSLINGDSFASKKTLSADYTFSRLFNGYTNLLSAENLILPATTLRQYCYREMFYQCTSLVTAPSILPATTLANYCYYCMFRGCTSLVAAPALPATTLAEYCYAIMFEYCSSLTTAPALPATTLAKSCYRAMFGSCTNLVAAPALPATTLAIYCYQNMFYDCRNLTTAPAVLPATTLANNCYDNMFYDCSSLVAAPELPATTLTTSCYYYMFKYCISLNYIKCLATDISASGCTTDWVDDVASTGTFVKDASMTSWTTGTSGIPSGWTVQDDGAAPTDNWVLVDGRFTSPRKIKADYSLIEDDNSSVRNDYELGSQSEPCMVLYLNEPTLEFVHGEYGLDLGEFEYMVAVISASGELKGILEDGVEYSEIDGTNITEMDYILPTVSDNFYLYATE